MLSHIKSKDKDVPVIIISGHANIEMAVKSLHEGAFEFIEKPFDQGRLLILLKEQLKTTISKNKTKNMKQNYFLPMS